MRRAAVALLLAGLAGCGGPKPIVLQPPAGPPTGVDGRYRGTARLVHAENRFCPRSGPRVYEVQNGTVTLSYQGAGRARVPLSAPIGPDGAFDTSDGEGRLQGHAANGELEMTVVSQSCEHHWTMHKMD